MITNEQLYDQNSIILAKLECLLSTFINRSNTLMATVQEVQAEQAVSIAAIEAERAEVKAALDEQAVAIQALNDAIAAMPNGGVATQEELDALYASAQAVTAAVSSIYVPAVAPEA